MGIPDLTTRVGDETAQILAFRPRTKTTPENTIPTIVVNSSSYNPSAIEAQQNSLIGQIFNSYVFASKKEQMASQLSSLEKVDNLIETRFHQSMQLAAKEDTQNGVFGGTFVLDPRAKEGFASVFGRSLAEEFYKITDQNQKANDGLRLFYRSLQLTLLTNYGKVLKKIETLSHEEFEKELESIRFQKNDWEKMLNDSVLIPSNFKKPLKSLLSAFVENYVVPVWELETAQRQSHESEVAKSA